MSSCDIGDWQGNAKLTFSRQLYVHYVCTSRRFIKFTTMTAATGVSFEQTGTRTYQQITWPSKDAFSELQSIALLSLSPQCIMEGRRHCIDHVLGPRRISGIIDRAFSCEADPQA